MIRASSSDGDLVLDCFCGSGTTAVVAEKLGRRWIACDLGRFAIHTTRKRLLGIPGLRPFVVQNLGKYERQLWAGAEFGDGNGQTAPSGALRAPPPPHSEGGAEGMNNGSSPALRGRGTMRSMVEGALRAPNETFRRARALRRAMSLPEVVLWQALRKGRLAGLRFRRQHPIGPYILDFYCPSARLAIEVDGFAHDTAAVVRHDERRQAWLAQRGVTVLRIPAGDVLRDERLTGVLLCIERAAAAAPSGSAPSGALRAPPPPLRGGGTRRS